MGKFVAVSSRGQGVLLDRHMLPAVPLPHGLTRGIDLANIVTPDAHRMLAAGYAPLHAGGMFRGQQLPAKIHEVAIGAAAQVVMLIWIDIFRHEVTVPIELPH